MSEMFMVPKKRLQKSILLRGKTDEENIVEYTRIKKLRELVKYKKRPFYINDFSDLNEIAARKNATRNIKILHAAVHRSNEASELLQEFLNDQDRRKANLLKSLQDLEDKCWSNIKKRETGKVECIHKIKKYLFDVQTFKVEKEKQDILIRIGLILESLLHELEPYDELLGNLALQDKSFKSKADTLDVRKNILMNRRSAITQKLEEVLAETEDLKQKLFSRIFELRETIHSDENTVNKLFEKEVKTMRTVLELENTLSSIRVRAKNELNEAANFYWFLDWVLTDVIGMESLAEVTLASSPRDKVEAIIEIYKNMKSFTANQPRSKASHLVEQIF